MYALVLFIVLISCCASSIAQRNFDIVVYGGTDIDNHNEFQNSPAVGGLALEFYKRIAKAYGRLDDFENALLSKTKNTSFMEIRK